MKRLAVVISALAVSAAALADPSPADAQRRVRARKIDGVRFDAHLNAAWHAAFGVGMRIDIPIVEDGFIDGVEDEFALSPGFDAYFLSWSRRCHQHGGDRHCHGDTYDGFAFWTGLLGQWNFYLSEDWSVFPELGFVVGFFDEYYHDGFQDTARFFVRPSGSVGARWHFTDRNALLFRVNWPAGAQFGITF